MKFLPEKYTNRDLIATIIFAIFFAIMIGTITFNRFFLKRPSKQCKKKKGYESVSDDTSSETSIYE